jgi:hypothetical protein
MEQEQLLFIGIMAYYELEYIKINKKIITLTYKMRPKHPSEPDNAN